jgi:hypothetical protein
VVSAILVASCSSAPGPSSRPAQQVEALTDAPTPQPRPVATASSSFGPEATSGPVHYTALVPGTVNRSSLAVSATYRVNAAISVGTGALDVTTLIRARNDSGAAIDRLELNTIAARLGDIRVTEATVDDLPVEPRISDQTLRVPLGGVLPDGAATTVRISYRATLRQGLDGSDWMFTRSGGTLALYRWIPWISQAVPFARPNDGDPFVTTTSPRVDVELLTDRRMVLAGPSAAIARFDAGSGYAWSFSASDVRDVSVILAPDFHITSGVANGIPVRAYTRPGGMSGSQLIALARDALMSEARQLGVPYPWTVLAVVETRGGHGLESPGLIWIPRTVDTLNRTYLVYHETAHQWFYGLVGNNQQAEPFADEAAADLLARTELGTLRSSRCPREDLDNPITAYSDACYYEVVYVQGGGVLDGIRRQMGTSRFWSAMGGYLEDNRFGFGGTRMLLDALRAASPVNLLPTLRTWFPDTY